VRKNALVKGVAALASLGLLAACGSASGGSSDEEATALPDTVRLIVPFAPGGGQERAARQIAPYMEKALDRTIAIENIEGGGTGVGTGVAVRDGTDCSTILLNPIPHLNFAWMLEADTEYTWEDVSPIGGIYRENSLLVVGKDAPWDSVEELVEDARERPGEISFSTSAFSSPFYLGLLALEQAADVDFNIVNYDGGGPARLALESGEVDGTAVGEFAYQPIAETSKVLASLQNENDRPEMTQNAPTVPDELGLDDWQEPPITYVAMWVSKECEENQPELYQTLVDALEAATNDPGYAKDVTETGEPEKAGDFIAPDEFRQIAEDQLDALFDAVEEAPDLELAEGRERP
jgi:putative tricarboxylic transport membrane protein